LPYYHIDSEVEKEYVNKKREMDAMAQVLYDKNGMPIDDTNGLPVRNVTAYDPVDDMIKVKSMQKKWKSDFSGAALDTTKWEVVQTGAGQTISVGGNELTIATGTTVNAETIILSKEVFTSPVKAWFAPMISQKIANQEFYVEMVSVDPVTLIPDGLDIAAWKISGTDSLTNTNAVYQTGTNGMAVTNSAAVAIGNAQTAYGIYEIEMFTDEIWFHSRQMDQANGRQNSYAKHNNIPNPNKLYKARIRVKNGSTAPASTTNFKMAFVNISDYAELTAEITAGRGNNSIGQALAAQVVNKPNIGTVDNVRLDANTTPFTDTTTNQVANATYTGTTRDMGASYNAWNRLRVAVMHLAGNTPGHLVVQQSTDNATWRETHRVPVPSESAMYRTFDFPVVMRYIRVIFINGATAQTGFFLSTALVRVDGGSDYDKNITFVHSTAAQAASAAFNGPTLDLGSNHSFQRHRATVYADQGGTLSLDESRDGTNWRTVGQLNFAPSGTNLGTVEALIVARYVRVRYTNGATANTAFELQSTLMKS
jgi:hypothetical protein